MKQRDEHMTSYAKELRGFISTIVTTKDQANFLGRCANHIAELEAENARLREQALERSWAGQVDRQGGSFDQSELDSRENW